MTTLLITLSAPETASQAAQGARADGYYAYALVQATGELASHGHAALALLPRADRTTLAVPASAVSWHALELPRLPRGTSQAKLRAVLDGMLEDRLLDDTATVHMAVQTGGAPHCWVAVCDKAWLQAAVQRFEHAGHKLDRIIALASPCDPTLLQTGAGRSIHVSGSAHNAFATVCDAQGVLPIGLDQVRTLLGAAWWDADGAPQSDVVCSAEPAVAQLAQDALRCKVPILQAAPYALAAMHNSRMDLAQFDLSVAGRGRWLQQLGAALQNLRSAPQWRAARWGALALLVANVLGLNAWAWQEKNSLEAKRHQLRSVLADTFPKLKVVIDPPLQMQRELVALRQASGALSARDLEAILHQIGSLNSTPGSVLYAPTAIEYIAGELSIPLAPNATVAASELDRMNTQLQVVGLQARATPTRLILAAQPTGGGAQ